MAFIPTYTLKNMAESSAEFELLLTCARTHLDKEAMEHMLQLVQGDLDWTVFIRLGRYHNVLPLLHRSLASVDIPQNVRAFLEQSYFKTGAHNLMLKQELEKLSRLFKEVRVGVIFFKGTVLAQVAYGNLGLRSCTDIDLLIPGGALDAIQPYLRQENYRPFYKYGQLRGLRKTFELYLSKQFSFMQGTQYALDVHLGLMPPGYYFPIPFPALLDRSEQVTVVDTPVRSFSPEDLLLILCYQGVKNRWERLKHICDVAELTRARPDLDWDVVWRRAREIRGKRIVSLGLYLARELLDAPLPNEVAQWVENEKLVEQLVRQIAERLPQQMKLGLASYSERLRFHLKVQDSFGTKLRYCLYSLLRQIQSSTRAA